ncbi:MAG: hypothetical protein R3E88_13630 [Myxococcota bacterium]|nr:hypothetical protein [Myxococcales bacterium]
MIRATARRALLGALLLASAACVAPPPYRRATDYPRRIADVQAVTLVPPLVSVYAMSSGNVEQEVQEWSDAANRHAHAAVRDFVERAGKRYVAYAGSHPPRPDFRLGAGRESQRSGLTKAEESWLLFESLEAAVLRHTYDPAHTFPREMKGLSYTLGAESRALLDGTQADAFLLMIATDHVPTAERQALIGIGAAAAVVTRSYAGPGMTPAELVAALVDARTGDVLYFNKVSMPLSDLRDANANKALVDLVLAGMFQ